MKVIKSTEMDQNDHVRRLLHAVALFMRPHAGRTLCFCFGFLPLEHPTADIHAYTLTWASLQWVPRGFCYLTTVFPLPPPRLGIQDENGFTCRCFHAHVAEYSVRTETREMHTKFQPPRREALKTRKESNIRMGPKIYDARLWPIL